VPITKITKAESLYKEALEIYRNLAEENPRVYLPDVAMTLNNLSLYYLKAVPDKEKSIAFAKEVMQIAQDFQKIIWYGNAKRATWILPENGEFVLTKAQTDNHQRGSSNLHV